MLNSKNTLKMSFIVLGMYFQMSIAAEDDLGTKSQKTSQQQDHLARTDNLEGRQKIAQHIVLIHKKSLEFKALYKQMLDDKEDEVLQLRVQCDIKISQFQSFEEQIEKLAQQKNKINDTKLRNHESQYMSLVQSRADCRNELDHLMDQIQKLDTEVKEKTKYANNIQDQMHAKMQYLAQILMDYHKRT